MTWLIRIRIDLVISNNLNKGADLCHSLIQRTTGEPGVCGGTGFLQRLLHLTEPTVTLVLVAKFLIHGAEVLVNGFLNLLLSLLYRAFQITD